MLCQFSACDAQIAHVPTAWIMTMVIPHDDESLACTCKYTVYFERHAIQGMRLLHPHGLNCLSPSNFSPLPVLVENSKRSLTETTCDLSFWLYRALTHPRHVHLAKPSCPCFCPRTWRRRRGPGFPQGSCLVQGNPKRRASRPTSQGRLAIVEWPQISMLRASE